MVPSMSNPDAPEPTTSSKGAPSRDTAERDAFSPGRMSAVILAGASGPPAVDGGPRRRNKNYFTLRGRPVVQHAIDLVVNQGFRRVVLVTERERAGDLELPAGACVIESRARQSDNFVAVQEEVSFAEEERALVLFGDTPLVTAGAVHDFLSRCRSAPADFHHGLVPYAFVGPFMDFFPKPWIGRRPFHCAEFTARLGCLSEMRPAGFDAAAARAAVDTVMGGRKQDPGGGLLAVLMARARVVWGGLRFIGPLGAWMGASAILSHWLHQRGFPAEARWTARPVTLRRLDGVAERLLGCSSRFVPCPFGGTSLDVDSEQDLAVHERHFDQLRELQAVQEQLVPRLVEPDFDLSPGSLALLERVDAAAATEVRRHPEVYLDQRRILRHFGLAPARTDAA